MEKEEKRNVIIKLQLRKTFRVAVRDISDLLLALAATLVSHTHRHLADAPNPERFTVSPTLGNIYRCIEIVI